MNKEDDPRYIRCEELLRETLKTIIEQSTFEDITITSLCEKAGINRKTFYLHYNNISELLFATLDELNSKLIIRIQDLDIRDLKTLIFEYITFIETENVFFEKIISNENYSYILNRNVKNFFESAHDLYKPLRNIEKTKQNLIIAFINTTFFSLYKEWSLNGKRLRVDELVELMSMLINSGISSYQ